jgi:hypothetical protein
MYWAHSCLKTIQPVPSVEAPHHNAGEVSSSLSTTSRLRRVGQRSGFGVLSLRRARVPSERTLRLLCCYPVETSRIYRQFAPVFEQMSHGVNWRYTRLDLTQHERERLASLGVLEAVERLGTVVKRPAEVIPFPKSQPKP